MTTNSTTFVNGTTVTSANWFNDIDARIYDDVQNVKNFGALGDGTTDDGAAIAAAIAAIGSNGGTVYFPPGTYKITAEIGMSKNGILFLGSGTNCILKQFTTNAKIINNSGASNYFANFLMTYNGTPVSGASAFFTTGANTRVDTVFCTSSYNAFEVTTGSIQMFTNLTVTNYVNIAFTAYSVGDVYLSRFSFNAGNATNGAGGGIRIVNLAQGIFVTDGDIINGVYSMTMDAVSYVAASRPAFIKFVDVIFDSAATTGILISNTVATEFIGCQIGAGTTPNTNADGVTMANSTDSIKFTNCQFTNNGGHGVNLSSTSCKRTTFIGCSFEGNSTVAGSGTKHGLNVAANVTDFIVSNCVAGNNGVWSGGQQGYGIKVNTGTSDRYIIADNLISNNVTGGVSDGGSGANKRVANNY